MIEYVQGIEYVHRKSGYVQGNKYVHKRVRTYTVRKALDQFERNSRKNLVWFILNLIDHGKRCVSLLKGF